MEYADLLKGLIGTLVYSVLGIIIMTISFIVIEKITNFSVKKEIIEDENIALGTMFAGFFVAVAIIIAAAIV
jgi:putative membrane protein